MSAAHRFTVLDGLRGVAAFAVMVRHAGYGFSVPYYATHGYLAVDFFFCLSGFVVAHAYEARIEGGLPFSTYIKMRLTRLYPMILAGAVLGALAFDGGWSGGLDEVVWLNVSVMVLLPFGLLYHLSAFPVNTPVWSLFFELAANAIYLFNARSLPRSLAKTFVALAAGAMALSALTFSVGSLANVGVASAVAFLTGFIRVFYTFAAGVVIFRLDLASRLPRCPDFVLAGALTLVFVLPVPEACWWYDTACALLVLPLLVALGARARMTAGLKTLWAVCGALSYPVYVIHEPVLRAVFRIFQGNPIEQTLPYLAPGLGVGAAVLLAYVLLVVYDQPLRRWLIGRRARPLIPAKI